MGRPRHTLKDTYIRKSKSPRSVSSRESSCKVRHKVGCRVSNEDSADQKNSLLRGKECMALSTFCHMLSASIDCRTVECIEGKEFPNDRRLCSDACT